MARNLDDDAKPDEPESDPAAEPKAKASPAKPTKPAADKRIKPAAGNEAKASPQKPAKPAAEKAPRPPAERAPKPAADTGVQTEAAAKKKKPKAETGIATKPGRSMFSFKAAGPTGVWGVDLGQCALKAVRLEVIDGEVTATAFDYVEHPKILSQPDADPDELTREALAKFLSRNTLRGDTVAISVPGQSGLARFVKLPPVEEKKIPDIVKFEAKQQIPFNLDEVVWDYQKLGVTALAPGFVETEIGLFAMKRDMVTRYLQHFKEVGVEVHLVQMAPLALCNFVAFDLLGREAGGPEEEAVAGKKRAITALDIGADSSNLVITDGARIIWQRPIPLGGNHFTRALTKDLKLTFAKAEHLKRNAVKSPDLKKILASLKPVLTDFVGEVQRSLGYFTNTHRDAQIEYMIGLGNAFRLPGLQRFLAEKLQMDVRKLGKMERLTGDSVVSQAAYTENILSFAVAYGLALQGLKRTRLQTNLLPHEIRAERAVRGKKPWAVAAAALLMLGLGALGFSYYLSYEAYGAPVVTVAEVKAKGDADKATANQSAFDAAKAAALKEEEAVKSIIAGQAERKNWLELNRYVFAEALPTPDGANLSPTARERYWDKAPDLATRKTGHPMTGQQAFAEWLNRQQGVGAAKDAPPIKDAPPGVKPAPAVGGDELGDGVDDLIQTNIEFFDQRFCDDLGVFWDQVKKNDKAVDLTDSDSVAKFVRSADPTKPPEGRGWVCEVHGYTFHQRHEVFIADTLMDNIYRLSVNAAPADQPAVPPAPPAGAPAAPSPAPAVKASDKDAYLNKISHVVLYNSLQTQTSDVSSFNIVGQSVLDALVASGGGGVGQTPTGGPMMAPPASVGLPGVPPPAASPSGAPSGSVSRDAWRPLSTFMGGGAPTNGAFGQPGFSGLPPTGSPDFSKPKAPAGGASNHTRTEFVVLFIWKEPTPSDSLRGEDDSAAPKPATAPTGQPTYAPPPPPPAGSTAQPGGGQ